MGNTKNNGSNKPEPRERVLREIDETLKKEGALVALVASILTPLLKVADSCAIDLVEDDGSLVRIVTLHADKEKEKVLIEHRSRNPLPMTSSYGYPRVIKTGKSQFMPGVSERIASRLFPESELPHDGLAIRSYACVPLVAGGNILGALTLLTTTNGRSFDGDDLLFFEQIAGTIAEELHRRLQNVSDGRAS